MGLGKGAWPLPVVDEAKGDGVLSVAGGGGPALSQHDLQTALLPVKPHLNLDLIAGGHAIVLRYGRIANEQLHFRDKISSTVEIFDDGVDPVVGQGIEALRSLLYEVLSSSSSPPKGGTEVKEDQQAIRDNECCSKELTPLCVGGCPRGRMAVMEVMKSWRLLPRSCSPYLTEHREGIWSSLVNPTKDWGQKWVKLAQVLPICAVRLKAKQPPLTPTVGCSLRKSEGHSGRRSG